MQAFPHRYRVQASGATDGDVQLTANGLPPLMSASPAEFGGPGDEWSPETLLVGALADCFILTFRSVAGASRIPWRSLTCTVVGTLDRVERLTQFTRFDLTARVEITDEADIERTQQALERAKRHCLISSSLKGTTHLDAIISVYDPPAQPLDAGDADEIAPSTLAARHADD